MNSEGVGPIHWVDYSEKHKFYAWRWVLEEPGATFFKSFMAIYFSIIGPCLYKIFVSFILWISGAGRKTYIVLPRQAEQDEDPARTFRREGSKHKLLLTTFNHLLQPGREGKVSEFWFLISASVFFLI
ncbi:hypothetical protein EJ08DRAFT_21902 [Tothia fuscella]|uniref:Uncharacterized protein n=1 Tax=Tothia fuscella TaxID=1048955 RepID=A0A9P4NYM5_9PEZI|nr:hypothetical protein EJ08DRAFT_21902 [Tothia fuscella]